MGWSGPFCYPCNLKTNLKIFHLTYIQHFQTFTYGIPYQILTICISLLYYSTLRISLSTLMTSYLYYIFIYSTLIFIILSIVPPLYHHISLLKKSTFIPSVIIHPIQIILSQHQTFTFHPNLYSFYTIYYKSQGSYLIIRILSNISANKCSTHISLS